MTHMQPLGDQAVLIAFASEAEAAHFAAKLGRVSFPWLVDVVQAYATIAVFYDLQTVHFAEAARMLRGLNFDLADTSSSTTGKLHGIPCCYELAPDLARVAARTCLTPEEVIRLHSTTEYLVYAIGFCPGFPYLGYLPPILSGVPRLESPRLRVEAGSVGLTGRQTGIYPLPRPGGWNLIGRTPLELVHVADGYFPLRTGDRVRFVRIDTAEFHRLLGNRL